MRVGVCIGLVCIASMAGGLHAAAPGSASAAAAAPALQLNLPSSPAEAAARIDLERRARRRQHKDDYHSDKDGYHSDDELYAYSRTGHVLLCNDDGTEFQPIDFADWVERRCAREAAGAAASDDQARDDAAPGGDAGAAVPAPVPRVQRTGSFKARLLGFLRRSNPDLAEVVRQIID